MANEYGNQSKSYLSDLVRISRYNLLAVGYQQLTVAGTAVSLTVPADAKYALIEVESSLTTPAIRYLELGDKTLPTATTGIRRSNLDALDVTGYPNLINFRAIQVGAGTHVLNIQYYK